MMRFALPLAVLAMLVIAGPSLAQAPKPRVTPTSAAMQRKVPAMKFSNPAGRSANSRPMSGRGCISGPTANRAQLAINPITGKAQAAPLVVVPLGGSGGSVAAATTRAQQAQACAHAR